MATLYVENVPDELYAALRKRAQEHRSSIASEVISILKVNVPTAAELKKRRRFLEKVLTLRAQKSPGRGPFPPAEEMLREDRER